MEGRKKQSKWKDMEGQKNGKEPGKWLLVTRLRYSHTAQTLGGELSLLEVTGHKITRVFWIQLK
jgi:hypothetical protein